MPRTGRPKLDDPRAYRVQVRFSEEQKARLEAYCERVHLNKAQVLMKGFEELERQAKELDEKSKQD